MNNMKSRDVTEFPKDLYSMHDGAGALRALIVKRIRDPIYGYVNITDLELEIVDSPFIQRLRYIRQLQIAHLVYPSATHTRFHHSVGVMGLSGAFAYYLIANTLSTLREPLEYLGLNIKQFFSVLEGVRIAGLLHDVGHGPFSHAFDGLIIKGNEVLEKLGIRNHEDVGFTIYDLYLRKKIIEKVDEINNRMGDIFDKEALLKTLDVILAPTEDEADKLLGNDNKIFKVMRYVVRDRPYSADIVDYVMRDSYFTVMREYGSVDFRRILDNAYLLLPENPKEQYGICFYIRARDTLRQLLFSRFWLFNNVYLHKTVRLFEQNVKEIMLKIKDYLTQVIVELAKGKPEKFLRLRDDDLVNRIPFEVLRNLGGKQYTSIDELSKEIDIRKKRWKVLYEREVTMNESIQHVSEKIYEEINKLKISDAQKQDKVAEKLKVVEQELKEKIIEIIKEHLNNHEIAIEPKNIWMDIPPIKFYPLYTPGKGTPDIKILKYNTREALLSPRENLFEIPLMKAFYGWPAIITPIRIFIRRNLYENLTKQGIDIRIINQKFAYWIENTKREGLTLDQYITALINAKSMFQKEETA